MKQDLKTLGWGFLWALALYGFWYAVGVMA